MKPHQLVPLLLVSFSAALITRFSAAYGATLPIGDGGLWLVIAQSILDNDFSLPTSIFFNGEVTPFCYPPLAGYVVALLHTLHGASILELIAVLPPLLNLAAVLCFYHFAHAAFKDRSIFAIAILIFPLAIQSYDIFIAGGGVSRNLGLIFQLLAWSFALRQRTCAAGTANGLAILSHPTGGLWSSLGILIFFAIDRRISFRSIFAIALISALIIAPWLAIAIHANGLIPFLLAFQVSGNEMFSWRLFGTPEKLILPGQFLGALALIGLIKMIKDRQLSVPVLFLIALAIDHRGLFVLNGVVIGAAAASYGIVALHRLFSGEKACQLIFALLIASHLLFSNFTFIQSFRISRLRPTAEDLSSYREIGSQLTNRERLLFVRSGIKETETGEWLTVLSGHNVRPLPQGQEWNGTYGNEIDALNAISRCCEQLSWNCVNEVVARYKLVYDAIVIHQPSCAGILPGKPIGNLQIVFK